MVFRASAICRPQLQVFALGGISIGFMFFAMGTLSRHHVHDSREAEEPRSLHELLTASGYVSTGTGEFTVKSTELAVATPVPSRKRVSSEVATGYSNTGTELTDKPSEAAIATPAPSVAPTVAPTEVPTPPEPPIPTCDAPEACNACTRGGKDKFPPSVIVVSEQGAAGIGDRVNIIASLRELSRMLCARFVIGNPCEWLASRHNNNMSLSCNHSWDRYFHKDDLWPWKSFPAPDQRWNQTGSGHPPTYEELRLLGILPRLNETKITSFPKNKTGEFAAYMRRTALRKHLAELGGGEDTSFFDRDDDYTYWEVFKQATVVGPAFNSRGRKLFNQVLNLTDKHGPNISFGDVTNHPDADIIDNYCQVAKLAAEGKPFIWYLYAYFYAPGFRRLWRTVSSKIERCNFKQKSWDQSINRCSFERPIVFKASATVTDLAHAFLNVNDMAIGSYITLRVRRVSTYGGHNMCDTSVAGVVDYVKCILSKILPCTSQKLSQPLLVFTDETDQNYVDTLLKELSKETGSRIIHADPALLQLIDKAIPDVQKNPDNFLVYNVGKALQFGAWRRLSRRGLLGWEDCRPCGIDLPDTEPPASHC